ncbi:MAG: TonB-dependent receptor [Sphingomonadales bacterium]|nr:TonB-dependent receptor [Sphingomonadales bacterium]
MKLRNLLVASVSALIAGAGPAMAQSADAPESDVADIIVTAQRREQSLKDVPLSVSVASAEALANRNFTDPAQLPYLVPSLQLTNFQASPGATNFSIRGIGTASFSHLIEPSVATVIDGIVMGRPEMGVMEFSDLERVEVLNGPQGMLFGKNASAGLVNIVTTRPKLGKLSVDASGTYSNTAAARNVDGWKGNVTVNIPITPIAAARISGYVSDEGPLVGNPNPTGFKDFGRTQYGARAKLLIDPGQGLSVYVSADYSHSDGMGTGVYTARTAAPGGALGTLDAVYGIVARPGNLLHSSDAPTTLRYDVGGIQAEVAYEFPSGVTLTNIAGYRAYNSRHTLDFDLRQADVVNISSAAFDLQQFTDELRLSSPGNVTFEYQIGLFYSYANSDRTDFLKGNLQLGAPPPGALDWLGLFATNDLTSRSFAAYAQGTYHVTDALALTAGARITHDKMSLRAYHDNGGSAIGISGVPGPISYNPSQNDTGVSWRLSALYEFSPSLNAYMTVARGYKGPGYNLSWSGVPGAAPVGSETSMDYEAGLKGNLFGRVNFGLSAYWEEFDNFQAQSYADTDTPGVGTFLIQNVGTLRARGFEGNLSARLGRILTLSASGAYNDAVYTSFPGATCYPGQTAAQGCIASSYDASGQRLINAPEWSGTVALDFDAPLSGDLALIGHADVYGRSKVNFQPNGDPTTAQPGYATVNGSIGVSGGEGRWRASVFCRNCFDKRFVTFIESNPTGAVGDYNQSYAVDSFRTVGVTVKVSY